MRLPWILAKPPDDGVNTGTLFVPRGQDLVQR